MWKYDRVGSSCTITCMLQLAVWPYYQPFTCLGSPAKVVHQNWPAYKSTPWLSVLKFVLIFLTYMQVYTVNNNMRSSEINIVLLHYKTFFQHQPGQSHAIATRLSAQPITACWMTMWLHEIRMANFRIFKDLVCFPSEWGMLTSLGWDEPCLLVLISNMNFLAFENFWESFFESVIPLHYHINHIVSEAECAAVQQAGGPQAGNLVALLSLVMCRDNRKSRPKMAKIMERKKYGKNCKIHGIIMALAVKSKHGSEAPMLNI